MNSDENKHLLCIIVSFSPPNCGLWVCAAEVQCRQESLVQLQEELEQQRAQLEQMEQEKDTQLSSLREELLNQTHQLDGCQARVSIYS